MISSLSKNHTRIRLSGENKNRWATYEPTTGEIVLHQSMKRDDPECQFGKTLIGIDHEYLHAILHRVEGYEACKGLDRIVGPVSDLTNHCIFTGFNLNVSEGGTLIYSDGVLLKKWCNRCGYRHTRWKHFKDLIYPTTR